MTEITVHKMTIILASIFVEKKKEIKKEMQFINKSKAYLRLMVLGLRFSTVSNLVQKW